MNKKYQQIIKAFNGKLVGDNFMKAMVAQTLSHFPEAIVSYICRSCWFLSSTEDAWAFTFDGHDLRHHYLIFISDDLLRQDHDQIRFTLAHEIGHVMLSHKNSIDRVQSREEIRKQEKEADEFAKTYL